MSTPLAPTLVRPFVAVLFNKLVISKEEVLEDLDELWPTFSRGHVSDEGHYSLGDYYSKEMGASKELLRFWVFFDDLIDRDELVRLKVESNAREEVLKGQRKGRIVNFDPGYVALEQMVLATGKPYGHRLFLGRHQKVGIYAELTYLFENKKFKTLPWSYPDYCEDHVISLFEGQRKELHKAFKRL